MKSNNNRNTFLPAKKLLSITVGTLLLGSLIQNANAQIGSASVHGIVAAQLEPQAGIPVTAKNTESGFIYKAVTQKDGTYVFKGLAPGSYTISVAANSGKESETLILRVGQDVTFDFEVQTPTAGVQEVTVVGTRTKYSKGGEVGTNVTPEQMANLPQTTRNFLAFADLAPGVQFIQSTDGSTKLKGGAQNPSGINVFIDGVGQKSYVLGGGITGQDSSRGNPFPQSAIGEYKVITQNYSAEYDQISSAAIVAVTKSGTNEFHGDSFYDYTDQDMRRSRPSEFHSNKKIPSQQIQYGVSAGGPIIKDKMHFFVSYEGKNNADPKNVLSQGAYSDTSKLPSFLQAEIGGVSADFKEDLVFGKLDYLINEQQKIVFTTKYRTEAELTNVGGLETSSRATDKKNDETRLDLNHTWRENSWLNDIHLTYEDASWNPRPHTNGIGKKFTDNSRKAVLNIGGGEDFQDKGQKGWGLQEDFTYFAVKDHVLKAGFKFKSIKLHAVQQQPFNPQFEYNLDYSSEKPYKVRWGKPLAGIGNGSTESDNKQYGFYFQDEWTATDQLTINAGLRWDYEESQSYLDHVTPSDLVSALRASTALQKSDRSINDYISNGHNRSTDKGAIAPRIGFTYDLSDDNDILVFGGLGRAYDRNLFDYLQLERTNATFPAYEYQFNNGDSVSGCTNAQNCVQWDPKYLNVSALNQLAVGDQNATREAYILNNKMRTPYSDQFSVGVRGSINEDWKTEVSISHVRSKNGLGWTLANRRADGKYFDGAATWGAPWGQGIENFSNVIVNDNGFKTVANSLFLKLDKPKSENGWGMNVAYTYTHSKTNQMNGDAGAFDYPHVADIPMVNAAENPEHRLVLTSTVDLPWGLLLSSKLNLQSVAYRRGTDCRGGWSYCYVNVYKPDVGGFFGYKSLDFALSKVVPTEFLVKDSKLTARFDIINATNEMNYNGFNDWFGGQGEPRNPDLGKANDDISGYPMSLKLGVTWSW